MNKIKELLFQNRGTKQTIAKNIFWLSFSQIASRFIRAAIIIYAARVLGATEYGVFSYALGLAGFFTIFADVGLTQILTREASQKPDQKSQHFATSMFLKMILLAGTTILIIFIAPHFSKIEAAKKLIPFVAFLTIFDGIRDLSIAFLRALEKMELEAFIIIIMNVMITISGFAILSYVTNAQALTFSYVASTGIGALTAIIVLRKEFRNIIANFRKELIKPIVNAALPIALVSLLGAFMLNTDLIMLGWWRGAREIGLYSAAQKIIQVLYTLPAILASSVFPTISRLVGQKKEVEVTSLMERSITSIFFISIPLTIGGIILGKSIISLLYGSEYLPAALVFQILIATTLVFFPGALITNLVLAYDKQKKMALFIGLGSLSNIVFNALLIPLWGIAGAAIATLFAQFITNGAAWVIMKKVNNFRTFHHLEKILVASIIMGITSFLLNQLGLHVLTTIVASGIIYFFALYLLKENTIKEALSILGKFTSSLKKPEGQTS